MRPGPLALKGNLGRLKKLKVRHPGLKVLISLGGWTGPQYFSDAVLTPESRGAPNRQALPRPARRHPVALRLQRVLVLRRPRRPAGNAACIRLKGLGGSMLWSIDQDDAKASLTTALYSVLR
ncbi:hypothetical protein [Microbispora bryophytorum]|uniref:hypothetical protein n=1 Tax=Microbispora bryophytorum TaxID=1460882 RepID=UPI003721C53F